MELHLVHINSAGQLAVLGFLFEVSLVYSLTFFKQLINL